MRFGPDICVAIWKGILYNVKRCNLVYPYTKDICMTRAEAAYLCVPGCGGERTVKMIPTEG